MYIRTDFGPDISTAIVVDVSVIPVKLLVEVKVIPPIVKVASWRFVPVISISVPPPVEPTFGVILVMVGVRFPHILVSTNCTKLGGKQILPKFGGGT